MDRLVVDLNFNTMKIAGAQIIQNFYGVEKQLFMTQGGSGANGRWPELSSQYRAWKQKHYPGRPVMVLDAHLMASLIGTSGNSTRSVIKVGNTWQIKMGSKAKSKDGFDYPLYHQMGGRGFKGSAKTRRTIDPTRQQIQYWMQIIQRHAVDLFAKYSQAFDKVRIDREPTPEKVEL
jgi:hypothetical protein